MLHFVKKKIALRAGHWGTGPAYQRALDIVRQRNVPWRKALRVEFGHAAILMTGDAQSEVEARLLSHGGHPSSRTAPSLSRKYRRATKTNHSSGIAQMLQSHVFHNVVTACVGR